MNVEPRDLRPPSLLDFRGPGGPAELLVGAWLTSTVHVFVILGAVLGFAALRWLGIVGDDPLEIAPEPPVTVIEARFVKLGQILPANKLPNRRVPQQSTAPREPTQSRHGLQPPPPDSIRPPNPEEDALTRLGNRANTLSQQAQNYDQEGDPEGIEEGTEDRETGNIYYGQLYSFFRRGWQVPTLIADSELTGLRCRVTFEITSDGRVGSFQISGPSGHGAFDQSVTDRMQETVGAELPPPPADEADRYLGRRIQLTFMGRHAR